MWLFGLAGGGKAAGGPDSFLVGEKEEGTYPIQSQGLCYSACRVTVCVHKKEDKCAMLQTWHPVQKGNSDSSERVICNLPSYNLERKCPLFTSILGYSSSVYLFRDVIFLSAIIR